MGADVKYIILCFTGLINIHPMFFFNFAWVFLSDPKTTIVNLKSFKDTTECQKTDLFNEIN